MSLIWVGLDLIAKGYSSHRAGRNTRCSYPFSLYPPGPEFRPGKYDPDLMSCIVDLIKRLRPKAFKGGRVHMNAIEIRTVIFAVRVHLDWWRHLKQLSHRESDETKRTFGVDHESVAKQQKQGQRVIRTLERHMKRANHHLLIEVGEDQYDALTSGWRDHVRWMRLRLVYFKPHRIHFRNNKKRYQAILDGFEAIANAALAEEGYELPPPKLLRRIMRLFALSVRRRRQGAIKSVHYVFQYKDGNLVKPAMVDFVLKRTALKRLAEQ